MANAPIALSSAASSLLPPIITAPIFQKAVERSAVMSLARKVPLSLAANTVIPVPLDVPTAGWVAEGVAKPVSSGAVGVKNMSGKKVALLVPVSQELAMTNPGGLYDQLQQDLPTAIGRAFDYAAIHGLDLKTGGAGPFTDYLAATPNSQVIGSTAANAGGVYADLWKGVQQVVNAPVQGYDFNGFAADPRLRPEAALSVDANGRPFFVDNALNANGPANSGTLIGLPVYFNTGVSGKYYRQGDTVQTVTIVGTPTGGTIAFTVGGQTFSAAYNATGATVTTAAVAAGGAVLSNLVVTGGAGGPYTFTFGGASAPVIVNQKSLTGGTAAASQATVAQSPNLDSGLRAIGGDWSQCAWGQGMDITIKISTEANYYDGTNWHSAFQDNLILLLVEAYYGFVIADVNAYVAYTHSAGS